MQGSNPNQVPGLNLRSSAVTRAVGGMATHWTCCCRACAGFSFTILSADYALCSATPHLEEAVNNPIPKPEFDALLKRAGTLLNVHSDQYDDSIRHTVVKEALKQLPRTRGVGNLPLGVKRRADNPLYVTWTGCDTILGDAVKSPRFTLLTEKRVTQIVPSTIDPKKVGAAIVRDLNTNDDIMVIAKVRY